MTRVSDFLKFAESCGLIIRRIEYDKWVRVPTTDKPKARNGAYKHLGNVAFVQNHATMPATATWFADKDSKIDAKAFAVRRRAASDLIRADQERAAIKARHIVDNAILGPHPYLAKKGFGEMHGLVNGENLIIPMMINGKLCGCQIIAPDGGKKFLFGQRSGGAQFVLGAGNGTHWLAEGYATALSLAACLNAIKAKYTIHACFSAHNLTVIGKTLKNALVCCDNDKSNAGLNAAIATGHRFFMPERIGDDLNDQWVRDGSFKTSQAIRRFLVDVGASRVG